MKTLTFLRRGALALLLGGPLASTAQTVPAMREIQLDSVSVAPPAADIAGWLLLDKDIQTELDGAVHNLYNFKFDKSDRQFRSLRRRYPNHPMAYFLLGLSTWWKMMPNNIRDTQYDKTFLAYLDTAQTKALAMYKADEHNYEACFFLSAAYGFEARLHSERHNWRKATVSSKRSLEYLDKSREANGLSTEFQFGVGLFDYYAVWISEEYPWLRPILFFFPKGNINRGLAELRNVGNNAFYTKTEANYFLVTILYSDREKQNAQALIIAKQLATEFPDNARFQTEYAKLCFDQGSWTECEKTCKAILYKYNAGAVGYTPYLCRSITYIMAYIEDFKYKNHKLAQDYYKRCIVFAETVDMLSGYYVFANGRLGKMASLENDVVAARRYYSVVVDKGDRKSAIFSEAKDYLRKHKS
jgi:hypothetical protein